MPASRSSAGGRPPGSRDAAITTTSGSSRARSAAGAAASLPSSRPNSTPRGPPSSPAPSAARPLPARPRSPSRGPLNFTPYPLFMTGGEGGEIVDADGNRYVDLMLGFGALIHGHAHPRLVAALRDASARGALLATASEIEVEVAERLVRMIPGAERIRFANTGTEACMAALRLVRGVTGRPKIVKFEGHYHGWADAFSVGSNPGALDAVDSLGIPGGALVDTIVLPWNDADRVEAALTEHDG